MIKTISAWCYFIGAVMFLSFSCKLADCDDMSEKSKSSIGNEMFRFSMKVEGENFNVFSTNHLWNRGFIVLADSNFAVLDSFAIGDCRIFSVASAEDQFIDLHLVLRSSFSENIVMTRFSVIEKELVPIYEYNAYNINSWDIFSKDSLLEVVAHVENQYYEFIVHGMGHGFPDELRMVRTSVETERDTLGHVMQADTSFTQTRLIRDRRTGVYMERYLNHEEIQQANRVFDTDSIPMLRGAYYYKGQWDY